LNLSSNELYGHTLHCTRAYLYADGHVWPQKSKPITCPVHALPNGCLDDTEEWASRMPSATTLREGPQLAAMLRLVVLARDESDQHGIGVHGGTFERLFTLFRIDPYIKYLVARSVDGYYSSDTDDGIGNGVRSFYLSVRDSHTMLWSCSPSGGPDGATSLSVIAICGGGLDEVRAVEDEVRVLGKLMGHPAFPVIACCSRIVHHTDSHINSALCTIKTVEGHTGMSPKAVIKCHQLADGHSTPLQQQMHKHNGFGKRSSGNHVASQHASPALLGEMSAWMSETSVQLAQHTHHLRLVREVVDRMRRPTFDHMSNAEVTKVASLLLDTSKMVLDYLGFMSRRVEVQQQVVRPLTQLFRLD
jgi:hypothetical protein